MQGLSNYEIRRTFVFKKMIYGHAFIIEIFTSGLEKCTFVIRMFTPSSRNLTLTLEKYTFVLQKFTKIHFPNPPLGKIAKNIRK